MSAIPTLTRDDVLKAVRQIDRDGVPPRRQATKFALVVNGKRYPPKYVVSLAAQAAAGRALRPDEFSGGPETNDALRALGFTIAGPESKSTRPRRSRLRPERHRPAKHPATRSVPETPQPTARVGKTPVVVRVVVKGHPPGSPGRAERLLLDVLTRRWPPGVAATFLLTPGGFINDDFPSSWTGRRSWASRTCDVEPLIERAAATVEATVTKKVLGAARGRARVITIGVDLWDEPTGTHAEFVAVVDVQSGEIVGWTGKSYPVPSQEKTLVQVVDLESHLFDIAGERALILGCHDLSMWNPRGWANQSPGSIRRKRCAAMRKLAKDFRPSVVLQHPHSTDTPNIWALAWGEIRRQFPALKAWASGIAYHNGVYDPRAPLKKVAERTRGGAVVDIVA